MIPVTMKRLTNEMDAYRAALASLLDLSLESIPEVDGLGAELKLRAWMSDRNMTVLRITPFEAPPCMYIARTRSPYPGYQVHSVVMAGGVLAHDPHPEPQPFVWEEVIGADFIVPMDPTHPFG
jgi:hypothetical protein